MRKADYARLAGILHAAMIRNAPPNNAPTLAHDNAIRRAEVARIATRVSEQLSVDGPEFLKACGIE